MSRYIKIHKDLRFIFDAIPDIDFCVAGGAINAFYTGRTIEDYDLFFNSEEDADKAISILKGNKEIKVGFESRRVVNFYLSDKKIQVCKVIYGTPEEIISNFDFTVVAGAITRDKEFFNEHFFEDLQQKRLVVVSLPKPLSTLRRLTKYISRGYMACNETLLKISKGISKVNFDDPKDNDIEFYPDESPAFLGLD